MTAGPTVTKLGGQHKQDQGIIILTVVLAACSRALAAFRSQRVGGPQGLGNAGAETIGWIVVRERRRPGAATRFRKASARGLPARVSR
jgi:hypothetical protein